MQKPIVHVILILALLDCKEKKRIKKKIKDALSRGEEAIEVERNAYRYLEKKKKRKVTIVIEKSGKEKIVVRRKLSSSNERRILSSGNTGNNFTDELRT